MPLTRRDFSALLGLPFAGAAIGLPLGSASAKAGTVVRATNQGASLIEQGLRGGGLQVSMSRRPMRLPFAFRRSRVFIPTFTGGVRKEGTIRFLTDDFFPDVRSYQRGINPRFSPGLKDTPNRLLYRFDGETTATYDPARWDRRRTGFLSDWLEHDLVPANADFEWAGAVRAPPGRLPLTATLFGDIQTTTGLADFREDAMGTDGLATQADFGPLLPTPNGGAFYDNAILLVEAPTGTPGIVSIGDSNLYAFGYDRGDAYGHSGLVTRGVVNELGMPHLNIGRGSDGDFSLGTQRELGALRRSMLALLHAEAGFTHRLHANGTNDITKAMPVGVWEAGRRFERWDHVSAPGSGQYICLKPGTAGRSGPPRGAGRAIEDGGCIWASIDGLGTGGHDQQLGVLIANEVRSNAWLREVLPDVPASVLTILPHASRSSDGWASAQGQTASPGWGDAASRRGKVNAFRRNLFDLYGYTGCIDVNRFLEEGYPGTETGIWRSNGQPRSLTVDGIHTSAAGAVAGSRALRDLVGPEGLEPPTKRL